MGTPTMHEIVRKVINDYTELDNRIMVNMGNDVERTFQHFYGYHPSMKNYDMPKMKMEHHEWLEKQLSYRDEEVKISEFGKVVANILGHAWDGLHHCNPTMLFHKRTDWSSDHHIEVVIPNELATWDFNRLTELVILCHDQCVRLSVEGANIHYMRLRFHPRKRGKLLSISKKHPTIEEQIKEIRSRFYVLPDM